MKAKFVRPLLQEKNWIQVLYKGMSMRKSRPRHSCVCTFTLALSCLKLLD